MKKKTEANKDNVLISPEVLELKKHVAVIHSNNKLSLLQRKIANALLFHAYKDLQRKDEHTIHIAKLCEMIGYASNDHKTIKRALINLLSTVLEWNLVDGERLDAEGSTWNASSIIADASIRGAICTYSYSNKMRHLLYKPNMYGRLDMLVQARFQSGYGLALYENCNRFQEIGQTPWFPIDQFRKLMGVEEGRYRIFRDFRTRVLDKAVEEVNRYSSLLVVPQLRRQQRQVEAIQFLIEKNPLPVVSKTGVPIQPELGSVLMAQFGLSAKQARETVTKHDKDYILEKIRLIEDSPSFKQGKVKNLARYLLSALRDDYQAPQKGKKAVAAVEKVVATAPVISDAIARTEFRRAQDQQLYDRFQQLPATNRESLLKKFEKFLTGMYLHVYSRSGLQNLLVQEQLCVFLHQIKHEMTQQLITYDDWLALGTSQSLSPK